MSILGIVPAAELILRIIIQLCTVILSGLNLNAYVYINQRDATLLMNELYLPLIGCTCFGLSSVHHQEHYLIPCITHWDVRDIKRV